MDSILFYLHILLHNLQRDGREQQRFEPPYLLIVNLLFDLISEYGILFFFRGLSLIKRHIIGMETGIVNPF